MMAATMLEQDVLAELDFDEPQFCESRHLDRNHLCAIIGVAVASNCRRPIPFYVCQHWVEHAAREMAGRSHCICGKRVDDCWIITPLDH